MRPYRRLRCICLALGLDAVAAAVSASAVSPDSSGGTDAIAALIGRLHDEGDSSGYGIANELAAYKRKAVPYLVEGLQSTDAPMRKWCARALTNIVGGFGDRSGMADAEDAGPALVSALAREIDSSVAWYMVQAIGQVLPDPNDTIPVLIDVLTSADVNLQCEIVATFGEYGTRAASAKPTLLALLRDSNDRWLQGWTVAALRKIGIGKADAGALSRLRFREPGYEAGEVLRLLFDYPEEALFYLQSHPGVLDQLEFENSLQALLRLIEDRASETWELREYLSRREDLPSIAMVQWGIEEFLPAIRARMAAADSHSRTFLQACARALGEQPRGVVRISETNPGRFRPASAYPRSDPDRRAPGGGHGDGFTPVLITGRLLMSDRSPAIEPRFYHTNDRMLLGEDRMDPAPLIRYDSDTGRFVFLTTVFAAYSVAEGQREPGPYQTGSARTLIEAQGAEPLTVHFYDEMPEVEITLSRARDGERVSQEPDPSRGRGSQSGLRSMPDPVRGEN
jgi:hypothetical protein